MRQLSDEGRTVFLNSHLLQEVELVCDHVAILNKGELKHVGRVEEMKSVAKESTELTIEAVSSIDEVNQVLQGREFGCEAVPGGSPGCSVRIQVKDQAEIDELVDTLRRNGISISSLSHQKVTLEDFFLDVVSQTPYQA